MRQSRPTCVELLHGWAVEPPDQVYRSATWLHAYGKEPWEDAPSELKRAWRHLHPSADGLAGLDKPLEADQGVAGAFTIAANSGACELVRGLVLADAPVDEIAKHIDVPWEVIELYEGIFWNVRSRLKAPGYICLLIESLELGQQETLNLKLAYVHGQDTFLEAIGVAKLTLATAALLQELSANRARLRALAAMQWPIDSAEAAARCIRTYIQLRKQDMKETRERHKLEQVRRQVETAAVKLDKNVRTQWTNLKAERQRLEEFAEQLVRSERALAEREAECARMMAEAQQVVRENEQPAVATPALAALAKEPPQDARHHRLNVV